MVGLGGFSVGRESAWDAGGSQTQGADSEQASDGFGMGGAGCGAISWMEAVGRGRQLEEGS